MVDPYNLNGWVPFSLVAHPVPALEWCWLANLELTDAFFGDTVTRSFRLPCSLLFRRRTLLSELESVLTTRNTLRVAGFIFHLSRCGSTLVSRALAGVPTLRVFSEPPAIDGVLRGGMSDAAVATAIRALGLRWQNSPEQTGFVVKFDCWNIGQAERLSRLFPETPRLFVFRDPLEVLVSQLTEPGAWTLPGMLPGDLLGIDDAEAKTLPRAEYCARALAHFLRAGADLVRRGIVTPVEYESLPGAILTVILPKFRIEITPELRRRVEAVTQRHVKRPHLMFAPDGRAKRAAASPALATLSQSICGEAWAELQLAIALRALV